MMALLQWLSDLVNRLRRPPQAETTDAVLRSGLAQYRWGSGAIRFTDISAVGRMAPAEIVTEIMKQHSIWDGDAGFRRTVTYLHELVHYLQDLTTGIGHWDFVQRQAAYNELMPAIVSQFDAGPSTAPPDARRFNEMVSDSFFNGWPHADRSWEKQCLADTASGNGWHIEGGDIAELFSMESILETEAVLQTVVTIMRTDMTPKAQAILRDNISIFNPLRMPEKYSGLCQFILHHTMHSLGATDTETFVREIGGTDVDLAKLYHLYVFLIDLACAHPPPRYFEETSLRREDFLPGVRLMRYMYAFQNGLPDDADDPISTERRLNQACGIAYPTVSEVYRMWAAYFIAEPQTPMVKVRAVNATERISSTDAFAKIANGVAVNQIPVVYAVAGLSGTYSLRINEHKWDEGYRHLDDSAGWDAVFLESLKAFYTPRPFRCSVPPSCPVCRQSCLGGFAFPHEVPPDKDCVVHAYLVEESARRAQGKGGGDE